MRSLLLALLLAPVALAADVSGYVYALDGSVVEGTTVRAGSATTTTDENGAFTIGNLAEGVVELEVGSARVLALTGDVVSITLSDENSRPSPYPSSRVSARGEATVSGRVTVDGRPLNNAPVIVGGMVARTNAKGEYVATGLAPGRHFVTIDERLYPRLRSPHAGKMYAEGKEPNIADLRTAREAVVHLELHAAPMIRGRVLDAEGKPVARARVNLVLANRSPLDFAFEMNAVRTTPDGRFSFPAPEWDEKEQVNIAVTPLLHSTVRSKPFVLGDANTDVEIKLPKLETVRIRVLDRAGKPIPDARVAFASSADTVTFDSIEVLVHEPLERHAARTNVEGELVVQLAADSYDFAAAAAGFQTVTLPAKSIAKPATVDLTLERAATIRGHVHRAGRGVADVNVSLIGERVRGARKFISTDAKGNFEIDGLAPGTYRIHVMKHDETIDIPMDVQAPGDVDVELPLVGTLRGRVVDDATKTPVREFAFSIESADAQPRSRSVGGPRSGESADGTFAVNLPAGVYRVSAGGAGYTTLDPVEVRVVENETTTIELPLDRGATVSGRVLDEQGLPVAEANVMIIDTDEQRMRTRRNARVGPSTAQTSSDGTFTLTGVDPGEAQLTVRRQGYVLYRKAIVPEGSMSIEVQLSKGLSLAGIVTRERKPVAGAQVSAATAAVGGEHQSAVTDEEGRFTLTGLVNARYTVSAFFDEHHTEVRDVDPTRQKELALSLDPQPKGVIYGTVTGIPPAAKYMRRVVMAHSEAGGAEGMIDDSGNYRIENVPLGNVSVTAFIETAARASRSSSRRQVEVIAGQPMRVDIELAGSVRVTGRVSVEGKPVANAHVGFSSEDGMMGSAQTRDDGAYELILPAPGRYQIYARSDQFHERFHQALREVRGGETIDIDLREQVFEGTVVDAITRQPIASALVTLAPAAGMMMSIAGEVPTDANGRFRITTAASGTLRLIASATGYAHRAVPVSGPTTYEFALSPVPDLRVRVLDSRTGAALDAHVVVSDGSGIVHARPRRSGDGTTYLFSLAPGKYRVMAIVQGYAQKTVEAEAPGGIDIEM